MTHEKTHTGECGIKGDQSFENREGAHAGEIPNVGAKCEEKFCQSDKEKSAEKCVKGLVNHEKNTYWRVLDRKGWKVCLFNV